MRIMLSKIEQDGVARLIQAGIAPHEATTELRLILEHVLKLTREQLFLRKKDEAINATQQAAIGALVQRRERREPLAYLLGERGFYGLVFRVTPDVLIPRPETELLVESVLEFAPSGSCKIADLGTGSGCIAIALACHLPEAMVHAVDISEAAIAVARENAAALCKATNQPEFFCGDLYAALPASTRYDFIVSNPPYISRAEAESLAPEVGVFEPELALFDVSNDGLGFYRRLAFGAHSRLKSGGRLLVEVGFGQAADVEAIFVAAGLKRIKTQQDLASIPRCVSGTVE
jgi:release factor glutamine methyltransferase